MREQLAAAIAADGDQRDAGGCAELAPDDGDDAIDEPRVLAQEARRVGALEESRAQRRAAGAHLVLPAQRGVHRREVGGSIKAAASPFMARNLASRRQPSRQGRQAGGGGAPADSVSTS